MRIIALGDVTGPGWIAQSTESYPVGAAFQGAELEIQVHPASRRLGCAKLWLVGAVAVARRLARRSVVCLPVEVGSPGDAFLAARGLRRVLSLAYVRRDLDRDLPAPVPVPGYRLVTWTGTVPDDLAVSFAAARRAMDDMPMDEADYTPETWDVERLHRVAKAVADRGDVLDTVAVQDSAGDLVAFTELVVPGAGTGDAQHYGTGVLPEHRGRGLARWMKVVAIHRARELFPQLDGLLADTAVSNAGMRRINTELGYRPTHTAVMYQQDLTA